MDFSWITGIIIGAAFGLAIGGTIAYILVKLKTGKLEAEKKNLVVIAESNKVTFDEKIAEYKAEIQKISEQKELLLKDNKNLEVELGSLNTTHEHLQQKLTEQKEDLKHIQEQFKAEFKALAGDVLKEQSKEFKEKNESVLQPFREQIKSFQEAVVKQNEDNIARATSFKEHIDSLKQMNLKISEDAQNLTKALKGDNKQQGNWGELILEKVLESSDLVKGQEYETQVNDTNDDSKRIQPDVVIYLPEEKHIIIDSKVSLTAYEKYVNAESIEVQQTALKEHLASIKAHIVGLAEKKYQSAQRLTSPDFILMFIPIESSFGVAIREDISLFNFAWDRKIVMVSPSTLLATLKTIASIWKQEKQNKNVLLIAEESGKLYDKFVGFLEDLESIETNFKRVNTQLDDAKKKLSTGRGNIIGKVEKLKELGAKASKNIDTKYLD